MNTELAALAARQYGVFDRAQWERSGRPLSTLHHQVKQGRVEVVQPGVYSPSGSWPAWERSLMGALLAAGPGAAVSHRSAARLWAIGDGQDDDVVEITVPRPRSPRVRRAVVHRSGDLVAGHVTVLQRFPVTKPARVIVDLGAVLAPPLVEDALDRALSRKLITIAGVEWMLAEVAGPGRSGAGVAGRILDHRALGRERPDGLLEPRMARALRRAGLPRPEFQYVVRAGGRILAVVDFAYPRLRLAIEVDGYDVHGSPRAMSRDFVRQNGLVALGWHVLRFTWAQVVLEPDMVAASVAAALAARS